MAYPRVLTWRLFTRAVCRRLVSHSSRSDVWSSSVFRQSALAGANTAAAQLDRTASAKYGDRSKSANTDAEPATEPESVSVNDGFWTNPRSTTAPPSPADELSLEDRFDWHILNWQLDWLKQDRDAAATPLVPLPLMPELKERLEKLRAQPPVRFRNVDDYCHAIMPVFMCELWEMVYSEIEATRARVKEIGGIQDEEFPFVVKKVDQTDQCFMRIVVDGVFVRRRAPLELASKASLCRLDLGGGDGGETVSVFAIVKRHSTKSLRSTAEAPLALRGAYDDLRQVDCTGAIVHLHLELRVKAKLNLPKAALYNLHKVYISRLAGLVPPLRPLLGLSALHKSPLAPLLLNPTEEALRIKPACVVRVDSADESEFNGSQKDVIESLSRDVFEHRKVPKIGLVHGPPGTGKSRTIVGLVEEITKLKKQKLLEGVILLMTPSNGAVDELSRKVMQRNRELQAEGHDEKCIRLIRLGKEGLVSEDVRERRLDTVAKGMAQRDRDLSYLDDELVKQKTKQEATSGVAIRSMKKKDKTKRRAVDQRIRDIQQKIKLARETGPKPTNDEIDQQKEAELLAADLIAVTLNSSGHEALDLLIVKKVPVLCVIVDEACQATELESLIPLRFGARKLFLVGDPCQLPPTILSKALDGVGLSGSAFVRCWNALSAESRALSVKFLDEQYRMVADIVHFPNKFTYDNRLKTAPSLKAPSSLLLNPYLVYDLNYGSEDRTSTGSFFNLPEIYMMRELCNYILEKSSLSADDIGVISFYKSQVEELRSAFSYNEGLRNVEINTVDGFQGREKAAVILSCVRCNVSSTVGFLGDNRRLNVAITRAKYALYIVGSRKTLSERSDIWKQLAEDAERRGLMHRVRDNRRSLEHALQRLLPRPPPPRRNNAAPPVFTPAVQPQTSTQSPTDRIISPTELAIPLQSN